MPFEQPIPHPLNENAIRRYAPAIAGVYGVSNSREWIYVGEADDIQAQLLRHLRESDSELAQAAPSGFVFETCRGVQQRARRDSLILEYAPLHNRNLAQGSHSALGKRRHGR